MPQLRTTLLKNLAPPGSILGVTQGNVRVLDDAALQDGKQARHAMLFTSPPCNQAGPPCLLTSPPLYTHAIQVRLGPILSRHT